MGVQLKYNSVMLEPDQPQHERPASRIVSQKYSFTTVVSLCLRSCKKKLQRAFKEVILFFIFLKECEAEIV